MVNLKKGILVECDPAMKQFLLHLDETQALGRKFVIEDLDETHVFISVDILETLQARIDDLMDQISFPLHEKVSCTMSRESGRIKDYEKRRTLDEASRVRRARKALEALEQDNFHDDPHADLVMSKKVPKFQDNLDTKTRKRKSKSAEYYKTRFRKSLAQMIEDDKNFSSSEINYTTAEAEPSKQPDRHFCAVCGFPSNYVCTVCGSRYCCVRCLNTHQDTRCLKWTA